MYGTIKRNLKEFRSEISEDTTSYFSHMQLITATNQKRVGVQFASPILSDTGHKLDAGVVSENAVISNKGALFDEPSTVKPENKTN